MQNKKSAKSWMILGGVFVILLFIYAGLSSARIIQGSAGFESLVSVVGFCGFLFLLIGIVKWFFERKRN